MSKSHQSQRAQIARRMQEREQLLAERGMQIKFLAMELQRKEYAAYSFSECIGALFASGDAIWTAFQEVQKSLLGRRRVDPVLAAAIGNLRAVQERYQRSAQVTPTPQEQVETVDQEGADVPEDDFTDFPGGDPEADPGVDPEPDAVSPTPPTA